MSADRAKDFALAYERLGDDLRDASDFARSELARRPELLELLARPLAGVALLGRGDASFPGRLLEAYAASAAPVPVVALQGGALPAWVDERVLVLAVCGGDDDPEPGPPPAAAHAAALGASVVEVGHRTVADAAHGPGASSPVRLELPWKITRARAHLGAHLGPLLVLAEAGGVLPPASGEIERAVAHLSVRCSTLYSDERSPAAALARRLARTVPLVVGAPRLAALAAERWKAAINANAKSPAFSSGSRFDVEDACGFGQLGDVTRQLVSLVVLRASGDEPPAWDPSNIEDLLGEVMAFVQFIDAEGDGRLAQVLDLVALGDAVSLSLAGLEGIDAAPVPATEDLRRAVVSGRGARRAATRP